MAWDSRGRSWLARKAAPTSSVRYGHRSPAQFFTVYFADTCSSTVQMVRMFDMFRQDNIDQEFKFLHVFTKIESCEKWTECRLALAKAKEGIYNPNAPASATAKGRPDGNKRAKAARDSAPAAERLQSSIE